MRIGVVSDTHGSLEAWQKLLKEYFKDVDMIIHAGDLFDDFSSGEYIRELADEMNSLQVPFIVARGNCDSDEDLALAEFPVASPYAFAQVGSLRIIVNHSKNISETDKLELAGKWKVNLYISGHTHIPELKKKGKVVLLNPGSPSMGKSVQSAGIINTTEDSCEIKIINIENGKVIYGVRSGIRTKKGQA